MKQRGDKNKLKLTENILMYKGIVISEEDEGCHLTMLLGLYC